MKFFLTYTIINFFIFVKNILKSPFSKPSRHRLSFTYEIMTYPFFGERSVELTSLLHDENMQLSLAPVKARLHNVTEFELLTLCALVKNNRSSTVFEIGTFDGRSTRAMAMNLTEDGKIFTLNLPPQTAAVSLETNVVDVNLSSKVASGERFINTMEEKKITQLWGDSAEFDFSRYEDKIDMVFIDGAHSEAYAANDTFAALKLIKKAGGIIVWHDAHRYGVVKFLKKWIRKKNYAVYFIKGTSIAVAAIKNGLPVDWKNSQSNQQAFKKTI